MPRAWFCIPSARPADEANRCLDEWQRRGYGTAVFVDAGRPAPRADIIMSGPYDGFAKATNTLCRRVCVKHPEVVACICGGDDITPVPDRSADELADEFAGHFPNLCGVMHPCGDGFTANDCCLISPWLGREYVRRAYQGNGPWCEAYRHYWVDADGYEVAKRAGVLWLRSDLSQFHHHWTRTKGATRPAHLVKWAALNSVDAQTYRERKAAGFPGSELRM